MFSFYFTGKPKSKRQRSKVTLPSNIEEIRKPHRQAYEPWTPAADKKLVLLFRQGKTVKELSDIFGRTNGAIRARIEKLLLK